MNITIFILAVLAISGYAVCTPAYDYRIYLKDMVPQNCTQPGKMCKTCSRLVSCTFQEGTFIETDVQTCDPNMYCVNDVCTNSQPNPLCDGSGDVVFPCTSVGMYPDPFDCTKYHICTSDKTGLVGQTQKCSDGWAYDSYSTYCKTPIKRCPGYPVPLCRHPGDVGALCNKSIYFTCVVMANPTGKQVLYPLLRTCPNGKKFERNQCI